MGQAAGGLTTNPCCHFALERLKFKRCRKTLLLPYSGVKTSARYGRTARRSRSSGSVLDPIRNPVSRDTHATSASSAPCSSGSSRQNSAPRNSRNGSLSTPPGRSVRMMRGAPEQAKGSALKPVQAKTTGGMEGSMPPISPANAARERAGSTKEKVRTCTRTPCRRSRCLRWRRSVR